MFNLAKTIFYYTFRIVDYDITMLHFSITMLYFNITVLHWAMSIVFSHGPQYRSASCINTILSYDMVAQL